MPITDIRKSDVIKMLDKLATGDLKDQRLVGLRILWDLTPQGNRWTGGEILDPDSGRIYKCSIALDGRGKRLRVRGFIGFSLMGRTEYWLRDE